MIMVLVVGERPEQANALAAVAGALIVVVLLASHLIDTDREIVERTLRQIAADVERNDADAVVRHIHRRRTDLIGVAESELQKYEFEQIDIKSNLTIEVESASNPPTAVAKFNVVVRGKLQGGGDVGAVYGDEGVRRYVVVEFQQEEGAWKVIDFEHFRPIAHGQ